MDPTKDYRLLGVRLDGNGPFLRETVSGSQTAATKLYRVEAGDFIYSRLFACRGAFGVIWANLDGCYVSGEFPTYVPVPGRISVEFLRYWFLLPAVVERVDEDCSGTTPLTRNRFNERFFAMLEVPLPPLEEQRRMVTRLEELSSWIQVVRTLRNAASTELESMAASVLISSLPQDIGTQRLGDLVSPTCKISYGVLVPGPHLDDGIPFVRLKDLHLRNPPSQPHKRIARDVDAQYERTRLRGGEILIGVVGSIGKVGIAPPSWAGANIARAVCRVVPIPSVDRDYLARVLSAQPCQDYFREMTRTLAQPTLNVAQLAETPIPVPSLRDQRSIVEKLDTLHDEVDALTRLQAETAIELEALLPAILDRAFKGEL